MAKNVLRAKTTDAKKRQARTAAARTPAAKSTASKNPAGKKTPGPKTKANAKATGDKSQTAKKKKRTPQRSMRVKDLVPGPLPGENKTPRQTAVPRKIRL